LPAFRNRIKEQPNSKLGVDEAATAAVGPFSPMTHPVEPVQKPPSAHFAPLKLALACLFSK
jgi:hypothetical protein